MSITLVQANRGNNVSTSNQNFTLSSNFTNPTAAGNFLVIAVFLEVSGATSAVLSEAVSAPGTSGWAEFGGNTNVQAPAIWRGLASFWVLPNAPAIANSTNFTWTVSMSNAFGTKIAEMVMMEFAGVSTDVNNYFDVQHAAIGTGTAPDPGNITTTKADLVLTQFVGNTGVGLTPPAGFTAGISLAAMQFGQFAYQLNSSVGAIASPWSGGTETPWAAGQAAFLPQPPPPCFVTYIQMVTDLANRLADPNFIFWTKAELQLYVIEALRTWNALTELWIAPFAFTSSLSQVFYDISTMAGSPRLRTVFDTDLEKIIEYHLLEPPTAGTWTGTSQFQISDLSGAIQRKRDEVIQATGCRLALVNLNANPNNVRVIYTDSSLEVVRARYIPNSGSPITLTREDTQAFDKFNPTHLQQNANPASFSIVAEPPFAIDLDTSPNTAGTVESIVVQAGPALSPPTSTLIGIPDDWTWVIKWGALYDLLSRDSEATDRLRADYCLKRFMDGMRIMQASNWYVSTTLGGVPADTPSMRELDAFANEWENDPNSWPAVASAGTDLVAPVPVSTQNVVVNVVGNAPLPVADTDCVSVFREHYESVLDYAQVLATFKLGGAEFMATADLEQKFFRAAADQNRRLLALGIFTDTLHDQGKRQIISQPRFEGGQ